MGVCLQSTSPVASLGDSYRVKSGGFFCLSVTPKKITGFCCRSTRSGGVDSIRFVQIDNWPGAGGLRRLESDAEVNNLELVLDVG